LLKLAESDETDVQQAAIGALGTTVGLEKLSALIEHLVDPASPEVASAAKDALKRAVQRMPDRDKTARLLDTAMAEASTETQIDVLDVLGVVGGPVALEAVGSAAESGDEPLVDAATRLLGEWLSPDAAPVLLHLAKTLDSEKYQIRALRGYVRIIRQLRLDDDEKVAMSRNAMDVAGRPAEKRLVLQALGRVPTAGALELIMAHLDDPQLRQRAAASAVAVAEKMPSPGEEVASAMKKVLDVSESDDVKHKARQVLKRIGQ
jgi:HEAT repeat protein